MPSPTNGSSATTNRFVAAIKTLIFLTRADTICSSVMLADYSHSHPTFLRRIMAQLVRANFVLAHEGRDGGYCLACPAHQITLDKVYLAVKSDKTNFFLPLDTSNGEEVEENLRSLLVQLNNETEQGMLTALSRYTIAEIAAQPESCDKKTD